MSSSPRAFSFDHLTPPPEQLCYVHCTICDTVLAVSVPYNSLFETVTVRCGHCTNLLSVNMRALLFPALNTTLQLPPPPPPPRNLRLLEELACPPPSLLNHPPNLHNNNTMPPLVSMKGNKEECPQNSTVANYNYRRVAASEKRQRVPSAYNRFIKDEIRRIKAENPSITHREAFSAAAKNWAHFPRIHFGLMPDQGLKKNSVCQQEGEDVLRKDGCHATGAANMGFSPF